MQTDDRDHLAAERRQQLLAELTSQRKITTNAAAKKLGVSVDTIRRDLRALHDLGQLQRVHGGAVCLSPLAPSFSGRGSDSSSERVALAQAVVDRLRPGMVIGLDAGTTTTEIASRIPTTLEVTVVTNNPAAALALADHPAANVVLVGGDVDLRWMATTGPTAVDAIRSYHFDLAVVGACSFDVTEGATTRSQHEVATKQAFIAAAVEPIMPVESGKLVTVSPFRVARATDVAVMLCERDVDRTTLRSLRAANIEIIPV